MSKPNSTNSAVEYRDIPGFPGYRAGSDGTIWSCRKTGYRPKGQTDILHDKWKKLRPGTADKGHRFVILRKGGRSYMRLVHRLVLESFVGPCPKGMEGCHSPDPSPSNNRLSNLRWDTSKANAADKKLHGTYACGSKVNGAKLTEKEVIYIREQFNSGAKTVTELSQEFPQILRDSIYSIVNRVTWKHV